jgi:hypothetical protein
MAVIAGIDEAGFGPVLGPLVVSAAAFSIPEESLEVPMWRLLAGAVSRKPSRKRALIAYGDSKRLYVSGDDRGLRHLERGILGCLAARDSRPATLRELLGALCPGGESQMDLYPWFRQADIPLPHHLTPVEVTLAANSLSVAFAKAGIAPVLMRSEVVHVGEFNRLVAATDNKSVTLFDVTCRLLAHLWAHAPGRVLRVHVDRQGGRMHYLPGLQRVFDGCRFKILEESETLSAYRITSGERLAEVSFMVEAEDSHLSVGLASMVCKYLRELFMTLFNRYWQACVPALQPTAGYYTDGQRFYGEILPHVRQRQIDEQLIYRSR